MQKHMAQSLKTKVKEVEKAFSNKDRAYNSNKEDFTLHEVVPLSENTACVIFHKEPTKKKVCFFFYYVNSGTNPNWYYFVPTDSHILGLESFGKYKLEIERHNFDKNFEEETNVRQKPDTDVLQTP